MYSYFVLTALSLVLAVFEGEVPVRPLLVAPGAAAWAVLAAASAYGLFAWGVVQVLLRASPGGGGAPFFHRLNRSSALLRAGLVPLYAAQFFLLGWREALLAHPRFGPLPASLQVFSLLFPLFVSLFFLWVAFFGAHRRLRGGPGGLPSFLLLQARQYASSVLGIFLILGFLDLVSFLPMGPVELWLSRLPGSCGKWLVYAGLITVAYLSMPFVLRLFWTVRPFPEGELRERLSRLARQADFADRRIMLLDTRGSLLNACTVGLVPPLSYILISDALLEGLPPDEVEAVFAHELGHVRGRHFIYYLLFTLLAMTAVMLWEGRGTRSDPGFWGYLAENGATIFLVWGIFFGLLSRRFERQADLLAAAQIGSGRRMQEALGRIASLSGQPSRLRTITHGSIEGRIAHLDRACLDPLAARRLHRAVLWSGIAMTVGLGIGLFFLCLH